MCVLKKGSSDVRKIFSIAVAIAFLAVTFAPTLSFAQMQSTPKLAEISLKSEDSNQNAKKIVQTLVNKNTKEKKTLTFEDFHARFIPIEKEGSGDRFIFAKFLSPKFGGCYARGCYTIIYKNDNGTNKWKVVFAAFLQRSFYDVNSNFNKPANLILSSEPDGTNPGVWMWNGKEYTLVNGR